MATAHPVRNPRTGTFDYQFIPPANTDIAALSNRLRSHQPAWRKGGVEHRIEALQAWKTAVVQHREALIQALTTDTGRYAESVLEANILVSSIDRWCGIARDFFAAQPDKQAAIPFIQIRQEVQPYAVVGVISPWNFPLLLSIIDAIPALLAGSAVLVKPSEVTPRFIDPLSDTIRQSPELAKVFAYVQGAGEVGAAIIDHTDLICFTGSVATGKKVYANCAAQFKPGFMELGGKDPALVFSGADLEQATSSVLWGSTVNCGHSCLSIERVYVQSDIFEAFVDRITEKAAKITLSFDGPDKGQIGPVIAERQVPIIDEHLRDALSKGAVLQTGSTQCFEQNGGYWCRPTILTNVSHDMKIMTEETFGPIIPIMPFDTEAEAIELANSTIFGLSGAVFAANWEEALRIGQQIEAGAISINDCALTAIVHEGEKNSFRQSGLGGTRMGPGAIRRFMRQQAFIMKKEPVASPWWF
jgi:succinate-semialdehyde dehydrogenase / glutarate-semialdehyde dehydrogenase